MKSERVFYRYMMAVILAFLVCQTMTHSANVACAKTNAAANQSVQQGPAEKDVTCLSQESDTSDPAKPKDRAASVRALVCHLGLGSGSVVADIGAGNGKDTWVFAEIVGETGRVFAEEIAEDKVKSLRDSAEKKNLAHVVAMLGSSVSPCLPPDSVDLEPIRITRHNGT